MAYSKNVSELILPEVQRVRDNPNKYYYELKQNLFNDCEMYLQRKYRSHTQKHDLRNYSSTWRTVVTDINIYKWALSILNAKYNVVHRNRIKKAKSPEQINHTTLFSKCSFIIWVAKSQTIGKCF